MRQDGKQKENSTAEWGEIESSKDGRSGRDRKALARKSRGLSKGEKIDYK